MLSLRARHEEVRTFHNAHSERFTLTVWLKVNGPQYSVSLDSRHRIACHHVYANTCKCSVEATGFGIVARRGLASRNGLNFHGPKPLLP